MNDTMNEITAFSPFGGRLVLEEVKGAQERANVPENSIETKAGDDRSMYVYVPASGCPDAKQTQVVMFLRDGADEASAQAAMQEYGLDALAEKEHFVLAFPNPRQSGWSERDAEDMDYLSRCFMALPQGKGKVGGFIGMIFYIGGSPSAGALLLAMSARRPLNVAGVLLSELPADYSIPQDGVNALGGEANLWKLPGLAQTPAGRHKQLLAIDDMALLGFSVRTPEAIRQLRAKAEQLP